MLHRNRKFFKESDGSLSCWVDTRLFPLPKPYPNQNTTLFWPCCDHGWNAFFPRFQLIRQSTGEKKTPFLSGALLLSILVNLTRRFTGTICQFFILLSFYSPLYKYKRFCWAIIFSSEVPEHNSCPLPRLPIQKKQKMLPFFVDSLMLIRHPKRKCIAINLCSGACISVFGTPNHNQFQIWRSFWLINYLASDSLAQDCSGLNGPSNSFFFLQSVLLGGTRHDLTWNKHI